MRFNLSPSNVRNLAVGWAATKIGMKVIDRKLQRMTPWRKPKPSRPWKSMAAGFVAAIGAGWVATKFIGGGDQPAAE